jgi:23S rRNA pseudouridine2605 synthase
MIRLNKFIADLGIASRRKADALIEAGKVVLNGQKAKLGDKINPEEDRLVVEGVTIDPQKKEELEYWLLNKPVNVISSVADDQGRKTVRQFFKDKSSARLYPVGRLDYESEGLMLMTNDGDLAYRITHPKYKVDKVYYVWVNGIYRNDKMEKLARGVWLREGITKVDEIRLLEKNGRDFLLEIVIHEGKKREIRRICAKVGWEVTRLQRIKIANLELDKLQAGTARKVREDELAELKSILDLN